MSKKNKQIYFFNDEVPLETQINNEVEHTEDIIERIESIDNEISMHTRRIKELKEAKIKLLEADYPNDESND